MKLLNQILNKISSNKFNQVHTSLGALSLIASAMNKDEYILNSFCVLAFDEVPNKNFSLKEYISRKADSKKGLNLVEKHLIAKEVSKYLKDASAFYDSELVGKVEKQANFKRPENVNILKSASFGNIVLVNNKYHLVNPLTKNVTAEYIKIATEPNLLKLNNIINSAKLNNSVKDWGIENGIWLISGDDAVINDLEHKIKDEAGYYCEAINQSTGIEGETPMYSLKIFIGNVSELDQNTDNKFSSKEENIEKKADEENSNTADEKAQAVKQLTGVDAVSANYDYYGLPTYTSGDKEYAVASDENEVYRAVVAEVESLLDEIGYDAFSWDNMGGIEKYVDTNWFDEARDESNISYARDIAESEPERFKEEASEYGITVGEEVTDDIIDAFAEKMKENQEDNSVEWFINNFGKEAIRDLMKDGRITFDTHAIADEVINLDGPGHVLSGYDGKEVEQEVNGKTYFLYRQAKKNGGKVEKTAEEKINFEKDLMEAGESKGEKDKVNETQLAMGKEVEKEHTTNPEIAEKITRDHLKEMPDYYTHLKEMEDNAKTNDAVKSSYAPFITVDATKRDSVEVFNGGKMVFACKDVKSAFEKSANYFTFDATDGSIITHSIYEDEKIIITAADEIDEYFVTLYIGGLDKYPVHSKSISKEKLMNNEDRVNFAETESEENFRLKEFGVTLEMLAKADEEATKVLKGGTDPEGKAEAPVEASTKSEVTKTAEDVEENAWVVEKTSAPTIDDQLKLDIFYVVNKNTHVVAHDAGFEPFLFPTQEEAQEHADKLNSQKEASAKPEVKKEAGESYGWYVDPNEAQEKLDLWIEAVGAEKALDDLRYAMGNDELSENLAYIFRMNDFEEGCSDNDVESSKKENIETQSKVVKEDGKYQAQSEKGRSFGTYDTKEEAEERVKQMEMFKHMDNKKASEDIDKKATDSSDYDKLVEIAKTIDPNIKINTDGDLIEVSVGSPMSAEHTFYLETVDDIGKQLALEAQNFDIEDTAKEWAAEGNSEEDINASKEDLQYVKDLLNKLSKAVNGNVESKKEDDIKVKADFNEEDLNNIWVVDMFLDNMDSKDGHDQIDFTKIGLIDFLNDEIQEYNSVNGSDYGMLNQNASNQEVKETLYDLFEGKVVEIKPHTKMSVSFKKENINKKADEELKQFDMKQELDGQKEFEQQDDFSQVSVPEEKEDTSEVTETMEAKPEETKGESFSASEFGNNMAYIQQNNPDAFKSIMNNLKQLMVGDQQKIYNFLENWSSHNFQDFTAMTREDPTYARHSQYQEQLKNNVLPKLKEMSEYKQAMEEKVSAEKGNVESAKKENIEKKAFDEEALNNVWVVAFGASSDFVGKTKQELIDRLMADRKDLLLQGKGALLDLPYLSNETSNETLYEWLKKWYNCSLKEITPPAEYDSSDPEDAAVYNHNGEDEGEEE